MMILLVVGFQDEVAARLSRPDVSRSVSLGRIICPLRCMWYVDLIRYHENKPLTEW